MPCLIFSLRIFWCEPIRRAHSSKNLWQWRLKNLPLSHGQKQPLRQKTLRWERLTGMPRYAEQYIFVASFQRFAVETLRNALPIGLLWLTSTRHWGIRYQNPCLLAHPSWHSELWGIFTLPLNIYIFCLKFFLQENSGYLIKTQHGLVESFEKEYYDLIRSAFLKYRFVFVYRWDPLPPN